MQQHSYPSHSRHLVFPAGPFSGDTTEEIVLMAAEPGRLALTRLWEVDVEVHIVVDWRIGSIGRVKADGKAQDRLGGWLGLIVHSKMCRMVVVSLVIPCGVVLAMEDERWRD
jgi:hypothetical protein